MIHSLDDRRNYEIILMSVKIVIEIIIKVNLNAALSFICKTKIIFRNKVHLLTVFQCIMGFSFDHGEIVFCGKIVKLPNFL